MGPHSLLYYKTVGLTVRIKGRKGSQDPNRMLRRAGSREDQVGLPTLSLGVPILCSPAPPSLLSSL